MKRISKVGWILFLLIMAGCNSSSGGGESTNQKTNTTYIEEHDTSPTITSTTAYLVNDPYRTRTSFDEGAFVNGYVFITDPDMDLKYLYAREYYPATSTIPYSEPFQWDLTGQTHKDMVYLSLEDFKVTGPAGSWRIDFQAEDAKGNLSNIYSFTYSVTAAPVIEEEIIPPIPIITADDITAGGTFENIILSWNISYDYYLAYYEIFRSSVNDVNHAVSIGSTIAKVYSDPVGPACTYYYWIRIVQTTEAGGGIGELPAAGKIGITYDDPGNIIDELNGQITKTQ